MFQIGFVGRKLNKKNKNYNKERENHTKQYFEMTKVTIKYKVIHNFKVRKSNFRFLMKKTELNCTGKLITRHQTNPSTLSIRCMYLNLHQRDWCQYQQWYFQKLLLFQMHFHWMMYQTLVVISRTTISN